MLSTYARTYLSNVYHRRDGSGSETKQHTKTQRIFIKVKLRIIQLHKTRYPYMHISFSMESTNNPISTEKFAARHRMIGCTYS